MKEADQFKALYDNDARVDPMQSRKMTARLEATGTKQPVLLRTSGTAGHGIGCAPACVGRPV